MGDVGLRREANFPDSPIPERVSSPWAADFRRWTIDRVKKFYPSNFTQSRRRVLAAILLAPLSAIFPTHLYAALSTRFRLTHGDKRIAIQGRYGSWVIDLHHLASDAIATATRHPGEFHIVVSNAQIRGTDVYVDFKAVLRLEDGVLTLHFDRLGLGGKLSFDAWTKGNPLVLRGRNSVEFSTKSGVIVLDQLTGGLPFNIDWTISAPTAVIQIPALTHSFTTSQVQILLPLSEKGEERQGLVLIGDEFVIRPEDPSFRYLSAGYLSYLEGCTKGGALRLSLEESDGRFRTTCNLAIDSARFSLTSSDSATPSAIGFNLSHAIVDYDLDSYGKVASTSLIAYVGTEEGTVIADGITTFLRGDASKPFLHLATNSTEITEFSLTAAALSDFVPCEGVLCDHGQIERHITVASTPNNTNKDINKPVFHIDAQNGTINRPSIPLNLHLRRKEDKVDFWVELHNLRFRCDLGGIISPSLKKINGKEEARILFITPPQHVGELSRVVDSSSQDSIPKISWKKLRPIASQPSRVAFSIPDSQLPIIFSIDQLLQWNNFVPIVGPLSSDEYREPKNTPLDWMSTVINLVMMSLVPVRFAKQKTDIPPRLRWLMPTGRPAAGRANQNWHARLIDKELRYDPRISSGVGIAIAQVEDWDWPQGSTQPCKSSEEFIQPMSARDRFQLRVLTFLRKFSPGPGQPEIQRNPEPILGSTVVLSSQGGYFLLEGNWDVTSLHFSLVRYFLSIAQGRNIELTIVREYLIYPYGHRLLLIKQTIRKNREVQREVDGRFTYAAPTETSFFLHIKDVEIVYGPSVQPLPWRRIRIPKEYWRSPMLDFNRTGKYCTPGEYCPFEPVPKNGTTENWRHQAFWPTVNGMPFEYEFEGMDYSGRWTRFKRAVIVIENAADGFDPCAISNEPPAPIVPSAPFDYLRARFIDSQISFNSRESDRRGIADFEHTDIAVGAAFASGNADLELTQVCFTAKYKPPSASRADEDPIPEHPAPFVPTVHWVEGRFSRGVLPNAVYENDEKPEHTVLRWLLCDPDTGIIHHPEQTNVAWILNIDAKQNPSFHLKEIPLASVPVEHTRALKDRAVYALIDRRISAPKTSVTTTFAQNSARSGAVVSPDIIIDLACRNYGASAIPPVNVISARSRGARNQGETLADYFPASSKLCGIELLKIIAPLFEGAGKPPSFSNILAEVADGPDSISSDLSWSLKADNDPSKSQIVPFPAGVDEYPFFYPGLFGEGDRLDAQPTKNCSLDLKATTTSWVLGLTPPEVNISASVANFTVHIGWGSGSGFNGIRIPVKDMTFVSKSGKKSDFGIRLGEIKFVGPALEFIDQISKKLQELGSNDSGWRIGIEHNGIILDAPPIMFPDVELGAFSVANLGIYSGLFVPLFDGGGITFRFSCAKPDSRFRVTAGIYAGGGYALLELDADHVRRFELCIEFGAAKSVQYGPVKGDVGVLGGVIYKSLSKPAFESPGLPGTPQTEVDIEAFVRAFGTFSAWNLISLFMELYVSMTSSDGGNVTGIARFTVSTKVGFVSYSYMASHQETLSKRNDSRTQRATAAYRLKSDPPLTESIIHTDSTSDSIDEWQLLEYFRAFR